MSDKTSIVIFCRLSFANIWEARQVNNQGEPRFTVSCLIDPATKEGKRDMQLIEAGIEAAMEEGAKKLDGAKKLKMPLFEGEDDQPGDMNYKGMMVIHAGNKKKPEIVDRNSKPIMDQSKVYSGCYCYVAINFFAYDNTSKGVSASLQHIMFVKDGDRLDNRKNAEDTFKGVSFTDEEPDDKPTKSKFTSKYD